MQQKIVLIGGPGTGKSSIIQNLEKEGHFCMPEISREVTLEAQKDGVDQLFLSQPLLFSQLLLEGRERQYIEAEKSKHKLVFFDRGIPDVHAYMNYLQTEYPPIYKEKSTTLLYDKVFMLSPWNKIYKSDNERYESFHQAIEIAVFLRKAYQEIGYKIIEVPFGSVEQRTNYILYALANGV